MTIVIIVHRLSDDVGMSPNAVCQCLAHIWSHTHTPTQKKGSSKWCLRKIIKTDSLSGMKIM